MIPDSVSKSEFVSGGGASWGTFAGTNSFWTLKMGPQRYQSPPNKRKMNRRAIKELQDCGKELQKSSLVLAWPGGLREALTI